MMDIVKVVVDLIGNDLVREVAGALVGVFAGGLGIWIWRKIQMDKIAKSKPQVVVNEAGLLVYKYLLNPLKDGNLKEEITQNLDTAGNDFNDAWDKGIRGIKI